MEQSLSWEATRCTPAQEIHFITLGGLNIFTEAIHLFTSLARWIHFMPSDFLYLRDMLMLSTHLCLDFPRCFFVWAHQPKPVNFSFVLLACLLACSIPHHPRFIYPDSIVREYKLLCSFLYHFIILLFPHS
jgi:hypothetical protein